jgi:uncharacterized repeat protein (TIGR04052 family)
MHRKNIAGAALGLAVAVVPVTAWTASPDKQPVAIAFGLSAGAKSVDCGADIEGLGLRKVAAKLHDARFYISAPALIDESGKEAPVDLEKNDWQHADVALLNFAGKSAACQGMSALNDTVSGMAPSGAHRGLSFIVGVDGALNHGNFATAPAPLDIQAMSWNWQAGRKFIKIEVDPAGGVTRQSNPDGGPVNVATWMLHLGSTGCKGDPLTGGVVSCAGANRIPVRFASFDPTRQRVVLDLAILFAGIDLNRDVGGAAGCMSGPTDPECGPIFEKLGLNFADTRPGADDAGKPSRAGAQIFRIEAKK